MTSKPNIVFILTDDHTKQAMSCYGSKINSTPNLDRIAEEGMKFNDCFCTNSICAPSRAVILSGKYSHKNGVRTLQDGFDGSQQTFIKLLHDNEYQTAIVGKWHLGHSKEYNPTGFDYWNILPGQGEYHNPKMYEMGQLKQYEGYVTDIVTDISLDWIKHTDKDKPFCIMCHHKAPHRSWQPDDKHAKMYTDVEIPLPETFNDDYSNRASAVSNAKMRIESDLNARDLKIEPPEGYGPKDPLPMPSKIEGYMLKTLEGERVTFNSHQELKEWKYQRYIKDYLRCVASVDDNVGRILDFLEEEGLDENTIVVYSSDQGFYLGEHGWFDKRFIYEQSISMPLLVKYPGVIEAGSECNKMVLNLDFAETFLEFAGIEIPSDMQGMSLKGILKGEEPENWRESIYYRYFRNVSYHNVYAHYGIRTNRCKLVYYYSAPNDMDHFQPEWELFDLERDPLELENLYEHEDYKGIVIEMKTELKRLRELYDDHEEDL